MGFILYSLELVKVQMNPNNSKFTTSAAQRKTLTAGHEHYICNPTEKHGWHASLYLHTHTPKHRTLLNYGSLRCCIPHTGVSCSNTWYAVSSLTSFCTSKGKVGLLFKSPSIDLTPAEPPDTFTSFTELLSFSTRCWSRHNKWRITRVKRIFKEKNRSVLINK